MSENEIALQYAKIKKNNRLKKNRIYRRMGRFKVQKCTCSTGLANSESSIISNLNSMKIASNDQNNEIHRNDKRSSASNLNATKAIQQLDESILSSDGYDFSDLMSYQQPNNLNLHAYTSLNCSSFSQSIINFIRKANISKSNAQQLIDLIQSGLPQPNNLPYNYQNVLELLTGFEIRFVIL